jgi:hypothetical protein
VQQRTYLFTDTGEQLPYAVFVSSKVSKDKKNPLIVALHGLGGDQNTMMRANALQLAEEGGYIMVGPMGYNSGGWYGAPARYNGGGRGGRRGANGAPPPGAPQGQAAERPAAPPPAGGTAITDPATLHEASEKDVMNVLDVIRKEFNVDENRTYLMGHAALGREDEGAEDYASVRGSCRRRSWKRADHRRSGHLCVLRQAHQSRALNSFRNPS